MINNCINLTKLFIKSLQMSKVYGKRQKIIFGILLTFICLFVFLPFIACFGIFMYSMTVKLNEVDYANVGLEMMCFLVAIFTFVFSFSVILNQFYFSEDIPSILPLPVKPEEIIISKFSACFCAENLMEFIMLFVGVLGFVLALKLPIINIILAIIGIFTLPIIPMVYCGVICLIIMSFTKFISNKEAIRKISIVAVLLVLVFFASMIGTFQNFDFEQYVQSFAMGNHKIVNVSRLLFPHIQFFVKTVSECSIASLLTYLLIHVCYLAVFVFLASKLYLNGVIGLYSKDTKTKVSSSKLLNDLRENSVFKSYLIKDLKTLFRSPTLFINCVLINFIWPIFVYVIYKVTMSGYNVTVLRDLVSRNPSWLFKVISLYVIGIAVLLPALNSIGASSFSREGKHFAFMKYIPVKYGLQWRCKTISAVLLAYLGISIYLTIFFIVVRIPLVWCLFYYLISFIIIYFVSSLGVYIDSIQPKLVWDDEINSLRENYNTFMLMGFALLLFAVLVGGGYHLLFKVGISIFNFIFVTLTVLAVLCILMHIVLKMSAARNIIDIEG